MSNGLQLFLIKTIPALFGVLLGVAWAVWGLTHTLVPQNEGLGAGAFPLFGGTLLCILSVWCLKVSRDGSSLVEETDDPLDASGQSLSPPAVRVTQVIALLIICSIVIVPLGFILSASVFCIAAMYVAGERTLFGIVLSFVAALVLSYVFSQILHVALPNGIIEGWIYQ